MRTEPMAEKDVTLIRRFTSERDAEAFSQIVSRYANLVYATCYRILHDPANAEDAAQNTFFDLVRKPDTVTGSLAGWLHTTATWKAIDMVRKDSSRRQRERHYNSKKTPTPPCKWDQISPVIDQALTELDPEPRAMLVEHFFERKSYETLACDRRVSARTISRQIQSAVSDLQNILRKKGILVVPAALATFMLESTSEAASPTLLKELAKMAIYGAHAPAVPAAASLGTSTALAATTVLAWKTKLILVLAVVGTISTGTGIYLHKTYQASPGPSADIFAQRAAYYGRIRTVHFPSSRSVGVLKTRSRLTAGSIYRFWRDFSGTWETFGQAVGTVTIPAGKDLLLELSEHGSDDLSFLATLGPRDLQALRIDRTFDQDEYLRDLRHLTGLLSLELYCPGATDRAVRYLARLKSLKRLVLVYTDISDRTVAMISKLTSLEYLAIWDGNITDAGLANLSSLTSLRHLVILDLDINGSGFAHLKNIKTLRRLTICNTPITDEAVAYLKVIPQLTRKSVLLWNTQVTPAGFAQLRSE